VAWNMRFFFTWKKKSRWYFW